MGGVISKSKSERKAKQSTKAGKRRSVTGKSSMLMRALENAEGSIRDGDGAAETLVFGRARAWTDVDVESGGLERNRRGTIVRQSPGDGEERQRASTTCGDMVIYDVDPEAEMTGRATSRRGRPETDYASDVVDSSGDVIDSSSDVTTGAAAASNVGGKILVIPPGFTAESAMIAGGVRVSTGGVIRSGLLKEVQHGDGLPDVETVARGNDRKSSIVESALRCKTLRAYASSSSADPDNHIFGNASQNGNSEAVCLPKSPCPSFPGSYTCSYGSSFQPATDGDFQVHSFPTGKCGGFAGTGTATREHFVCDRSNFGVNPYLVLMASADVGVQHPDSVVKPPEVLRKDPGAWLVDEEAGETKMEQTKEEMKAFDAEADKLAEKMTTERDAEQSTEEPSRAKLTEQLNEQPKQTEARCTPYPNIHHPLEDATPRHDVEESGTPPVWMEGTGKLETEAEDSDTTLTEKVAKEDVPDQPEDLDDIESWYRCDVADDCTLYPSAVLCSSTSRNSDEAESGLLGNDVHGTGTIGTEQSGSVPAGCHDNCRHGDASPHERGDAEKSTLMVTAGVLGATTTEYDASKGDAQQLSNEGNPPPTGLPEVLGARVEALKSVKTYVDADCMTHTFTKVEADTWSYYQVTGHDPDLAWSDAWVKWGDTQGKKKKGRKGGRGGKGGKAGKGEGL